MQKIYDVFYCGEDFSFYEEVEGWLRKEFPGSDIKTEYDDIHGYRTCIDTKLDLRSYYKKILNKGWACMSFHMQLKAQSILMGMEKDDQFISVFKEMRKEN